MVSDPLEKYIYIPLEIVKRAWLQFEELKQVHIHSTGPKYH